MPNPINYNEEAAAVTTRNGFDFVLTTDTSPHGEANENFYVLAFDAPRKTR